jgi:hypothetical protein
MNNTSPLALLISFKIRKVLLDEVDLKHRHHLVLVVAMDVRYKVKQEKLLLLIIIEFLVIKIIKEK